MTIKEYKDANGLSLKQLLDKIKPIEPTATVPLLSMMYNGHIEPTDRIRAWLAMTEMEDEEMTTVEYLVYDALQDADRECPVSRQELKVATKLPDRMNRDAIERLRRRGYWIVNFGGGYYITDSRAELESWLATYTSRVANIAKTAAAMRAYDPRQVNINEID